MSIQSYKRAKSPTRRQALTGLGAMAGLVFACGGPPAKAPNPTRPLTERRALDLIAQAVASQELQPARGREVKLPSGKTIFVDVGIRNHQIGVAYLTDEERVALANELPATEPGDAGSLIVLSGAGDEADSRILVLLAKNYLVDDHIGSGHEQTTITAENRLKRDARDFLVRAKTKKWP